MTETVTQDAIKAFLASLDPKMAAAFLQASNPDAAAEMRKRGNRVVVLPTDPRARIRAEIAVRKDKLARAERTLAGSPDSMKPRKPIAEKILDTENQLAKLVEQKQRAETIVAHGADDIAALMAHQIELDSGKGGHWPTCQLSWDFLNPANALVAELEEEMEDSEK